MHDSLRSLGPALPDFALCREGSNSSQLAGGCATVVQTPALRAVSVAMPFHCVASQVSKYLETVADKVAEAEDPQLLARLIEQWGNHRLSMGMIRDILMYMVSASVRLKKI